MSASWTQKRDQFGGLGVYTIIYLVFIYGPVLVLPIFSFNDSIYIGFPLKGFTLQWYEDMINNPRMLEALMNSLKVGGTVAVLSTILGTLAAKAVTRYRMPGRGPGVGFIMLPLVIPEIIMGIALLVMASTGGIPLSLLTIGVGHMLRRCGRCPDEGQSRPRCGDGLHSAASSRFSPAGGMLCPSRRSTSAAHSTTLLPGP